MLRVKAKDLVRILKGVDPDSDVLVHLRNGESEYAVSIRPSCSGISEGTPVVVFEADETDWVRMTEMNERKKIK